jgi:TRAP-type C4-dicarboxylate transport system substrate-binding protein
MKQQSENNSKASRRKMVKGLVAGGAALALGAIAGRASSQSPVTLRVVSGWEKSLMWNRPLFEYISRVNSKSGGKVKIEWVGGPEAVSPFQVAESVGKGVFDLAYTSPSFFAASAPEANVLYLGEDVPMSRLHEAGVIQACDEIFRRRMRAALVGIPAGGIGATFITREAPRTLEYFKGRRFRSAPLYTPMLKALGASTVTLAPPEVYSALENGVIDAVGWPMVGIVERKFHEIAKFIVLPPIFDIRMSMLASLRTWDRLDAPVRTLLTDTMREMEDWGYKSFRDELTKERAELRKGGVQEIALSEADARRYRELAHDGLWEPILRDSPKDGPRLKELMAKAAART